MPYGKTLPIVYHCTGERNRKNPKTGEVSMEKCGETQYADRRNKEMQKETIKKYCPKCNMQRQFKPKVSKHSSN